MKKQSIKFIIQEHGGTFFAWSLMLEGCFNSPVLKEYLGRPLENSVVYFNNDFGRWGTDLKAWEKLGKNLIDSIDSGEFQLDKLKFEHFRIGEKIIKQCVSILDSDLESISEKKFISILKELFDDYGYITSLGFVPVVSDLEHNYLSSRLNSILKSKEVKEEKIQDYISTLSSFTKTTVGIPSRRARRLAA